MAIYKNGPLGSANGGQGNMVFYMLNGKPVGRQKGIIPPSTYTKKQFAIRQKTALLNPLLKATKAYTRAGFKNTPKQAGWDFYAMATSVNNPQAIAGAYPDQYIDYSKVRLSMGAINPPVLPVVTLAGNSIEVSWQSDLESPDNDPRDQIMICAYFPEQHRALTMLSGARRGEEKERFPLPSYTRPMEIEVYLSYISDDRSDVSDSVHAAHLRWDQTTAENGSLS